MLLQNKLFVGLALLTSLLLLELARVKEDKGFSLRSTSTRARRLDPLTGLSDPQTTSVKEIDEPSDNWPSDTSLTVPLGNYAYNGRSHRNLRPSAKYGRVLLYMTTHFSEQHESYLKYCWKNVLARSPLLQEADVAVFLNAKGTPTTKEEEKRKDAMDILRDVFVDQNMVVYLRSGRGSKQSGAALPMDEAVTSNYFDGYDWVIRVNPDVLVRDDSFLRESMVDPSVSALLINCAGDVKNYVHTDFFMIKPELLLADQFQPRAGKRKHAEVLFTMAIQGTVFDSEEKIHRWIPGADPAHFGICRAGEGRDFNESPIIHDHVLHPDICSLPSADASIV